MAESTPVKAAPAKAAPAGASENTDAEIARLRKENEAMELRLENRRLRKLVDRLDAADQQAVGQRAGRADDPARKEL